MVAIVFNKKLYMKAKYPLLLVCIVIFIAACNSNREQSMMTQDNTPLFTKGDKLPNKNFTGDAYLHPLLAKDKNNEFALGSVTFEPGARTNWHTHPKGQVLIVTDGEGWYQEKGK